METKRTSQQIIKTFASTSRDKRFQLMSLEKVLYNYFLKVFSN